MRRKAGADEIAERLFDMVRDAKPDQEVIDAIAASTASSLRQSGTCACSTSSDHETRLPPWFTDVSR